MVDITPDRGSGHQEGGVEVCGLTYSGALRGRDDYRSATPTTTTPEWGVAYAFAEIWNQPAGPGGPARASLFEVLDGGKGDLSRVLRALAEVYCRGATIHDVVDSTPTLHADYQEGIRYRDEAGC